MDPFEVGYLELDIIKELLLRVKPSSLKEQVEKVLHEHVFNEGSFLISKEDFVFKWEAAHPKAKDRQSTPQQPPPPKVFLKLNDFRPNSALLPEPTQEVQRLAPSELQEIVQRRMGRLEKKPSTPAKFIGRGRPAAPKNEIVSETLEIHKRLLRQGAV